MTAAHKLIPEEGVKEALKNEKGSEAQLTSWKIEDFTQKGDNYASIVTSVKVDFTLNGCNDHTSYVIKVNPCIGAKGFEKMTNVCFAKEAEMLTKMKPQFNSILEEIGLKPLSMANCYFSSFELGKELLFLEDLRPRGFKMFDRKKGLDVAHTTLVLKELAKLHAASALLHHKDPDCYKDMRVNIDWANILDPDSGLNLNMLFGIHFDNASKILESMDGYESTKEFFNTVKLRLEEIFQKEHEKNKYHVICHGDAWNNNFLFRYGEDGSPEEVMLLDLQINHRVSFSNDLNYLFATSLTGDVRKPNLEAFLETYRQEFNAAMEAGNGEWRLTAAETLEEYRRTNIVGLVFGLMAVNFVTMDAEEADVFVDMGDGDLSQKIEEWKEKGEAIMRRNPRAKPRLIALIEEMTESGVIPSK